MIISDLNYFEDLSQAPHITGGLSPSQIVSSLLDDIDIPGLDTRIQSIFSETFTSKDGSDTAFTAVGSIVGGLDFSVSSSSSQSF